MDNSTLITLFIFGAGFLLGFWISDKMSNNKRRN